MYSLPYKVEASPRKQMSDLPRVRRLVNKKPLVASSVDFFGPYLISGFPNPRSKVKVWPFVFSCLSTGALHCKVAVGNGADAFLTLPPGTGPRLET